MARPTRWFPTEAAECGSPPKHFRTPPGGRPIGRDETGARRLLSIPRSRPTSPVAHTPSAPTRRPWCSTRSAEAATTGPAACRCPNGCADPRAAGLTLRARCGRSFVSTRFVTEDEAGNADDSDVFVGDLVASPRLVCITCRCVVGAGPRARADAAGVARYVRCAARGAGVDPDAQCGDPRQPKCNTEPRDLVS